MLLNALTILEKTCAVYQQCSAYSDAGIFHSGKIGSGGTVGEMGCSIEFATKLQRQHELEIELSGKFAMAYGEIDAAPVNNPLKISIDFGK